LEESTMFSPILDKLFGIVLHERSINTIYVIVNLYLGSNLIQLYFIAQIVSAFGSTVRRLRFPCQKTPELFEQYLIF
jgi:hypothetical protein